MKEQLEFIKKAMHEYGGYGATEAALVQGIAEYEEILHWLKVNVGQNTLMWLVPEQGLKVYGSGIQLTRGNSWATVANAKSQFKVMTMDEFNEECPWVTQRLRSYKETLAFYRGEGSNGTMLALALAKYREAAATLGQAQQEFHKILESSDADINPEVIDRAVFEEASISTNHVERFYDA